ncbi:MAG: hypothetical protein ACOY91_01850 [Pseudomonadota bacterium]|jgi:hypothetical protein
MRLATDDIVIDVSPAISLRPTLRAAYRLERKYDGFDKLLRLVSRGSLTAIADVIREGAGDNTVTRYLDSLEGMSLHIGIDRLAGPATKFIFALAGVDRSKPVQEAPANPISFEQHHTKLFRIATGLGWPPEDAWNATPAEIMEAYKGRTDMLAAIFGGNKEAEDSGNTSDLTALEGEARQNALKRFAALGDLTVQRMP